MIVRSFVQGHSHLGLRKIRSSQERRLPQGTVGSFRGEQNRRLTDAHRPETPSELSIDLPGGAARHNHRLDTLDLTATEADYVMLPVRHQTSDLAGHGKGKRLLAGQEADHDGFWVLPEKAKHYCFQGLLPTSHGRRAVSLRIP
jgi:hypothetical protein